MAQLIDSFDAYHDFEAGTYFTVCFDRLPSRLQVAIPLEQTRENMDSVLAELGPGTYDLKADFKNWRTLNGSDRADFSKDFPYEYLFKSSSKKLIVWVSLQHDELEVLFLYDLADLEIEQWVIDVSQKIRTRFGDAKTSVFKVLSRNQNHVFFTEDIKIDTLSVDISKHYNDDFKEVDEIISNSLTEDRAGLILLHGIPGTGKTSYIKHLITQVDHTSFIFIQNEFINELLHPDFMSFLLHNRNAVLIIEDAEKVITSRDYTNESSVVSTILQLTDGLFSDYLNIKIICTFNTSMDKIDKALLRKGRMIAYYEFGPLSANKAAELLQALNHEPPSDAMTLADIFNYSTRQFGETTKKIGF